MTETDSPLVAHNNYKIRLNKVRKGLYHISVVDLELPRQRRLVKCIGWYSPDLLMFDLDKLKARHLLSQGVACTRRVQDIVEAPYFGMAAKGIKGFGGKTPTIQRLKTFRHQLPPQKELASHIWAKSVRSAKPYPKTSVNDFSHSNETFFRQTEQKKTMAQNTFKESDPILPSVEFISRDGKKIPVSEMAPLLNGEKYNFRINVTLNKKEFDRNAGELEYSVSSGEAHISVDTIDKLVYDNKNDIAYSEFSITPHTPKQDRIKLALCFLQKHKFLGILPITFRAALPQ